MTVPYHSILLLMAAFTARERAHEDAKRPNALTHDALVAIVMASAALEGFINEVAEHVRISQAAACDAFRESVAASMAAFADEIEEIEANRGSVESKYQAAAQILKGAEFDKGREPYQSFAELVGLRNSIMHIKPVRAGVRHKGETTAQQLERRRLTTERDPGSNMEWLHKLESPNIASWACWVAHKMMLEIVSVLPVITDERTGDEDPFTKMRKLLLDESRFPNVAGGAHVSC